MKKINYIPVLLCAVLFGCVSPDIKLKAVDGISGKEIESFSVILQKRNYSIFNSKWISEDPPVNSFSGGIIVVKALHGKDTLLVRSPSYEDAIVGYTKHSLISFRSPERFWEKPLASGSTNKNAILTVPLFKK